MTSDPCQWKNKESEPAGCQEQAPPADLNREAANLLELLSRQSASATPLSISSKAAQAVLKQF